MTLDGTDRPAGGGPEALDPDIWSDDPAPPPGPRRPPRPARPAGRPADRPPLRHGRPRAGAPSSPAAATGRLRLVVLAAPAQEEADEYFDLPHESRIPRWLVALGVVVLVVVIVVGGSMWWYRNQVDPPGGPGEQVQVQIPEGSTTSDVGSILDDQGVISSATIFNFWVGGKDLTSVQAGTYAFRANSSFDDAVAVLNAGPGEPLVAATTKVSIPEGYRVEQIVARINEKVPRLTVEDLDAALAEGKVPTSLKPEGTTSYEGLLFPATYEVGDDDTAVDVLTEMAQEMEGRVAAMGIDDAATAISQKWGIEVDAYDLLTTASLVQEEAGGPDEAPKVATVIYNRLAADMPLGIDATSKYLADTEGGEPDYESSSPYNTRTQAGLPPTPIASPGEYALDAALHPADGPWLYYVLTDPGVHTFVETYQEFLDGKQECIAKDLGCG